MKEMRSSPALLIISFVLLMTTSSRRVHGLSRSFDVNLNRQRSDDQSHDIFISERRESAPPPFAFSTIGDDIGSSFSISSEDDVESFSISNGDDMDMGLLSDEGNMFLQDGSSSDDSNAFDGLFSAKNPSEEIVGSGSSCEQSLNRRDDFDDDLIIGISQPIFSCLCFNRKTYCLREVSYRRNLEFLFFY